MGHIVQQVAAKAKPRYKCILPLAEALPIPETYFLGNPAIPVTARHRLCLASVRNLCKASLVLYCDWPMHLGIPRREDNLLRAVWLPESPIPRYTLKEVSQACDIPLWIDQIPTVIFSNFDTLVPDAKHFIHSGSFISYAASLTRARSIGRTNPYSLESAACIAADDTWSPHMVTGALCPCDAPQRRFFTAQFLSASTGLQILHTAYYIPIAFQHFLAQNASAFIYSPSPGPCPLVLGAVHFPLSFFLLCFIIGGMPPELLATYDEAAVAFFFGRHGFFCIIRNPEDDVNLLRLRVQNATGKSIRRIHRVVKPPEDFVDAAYASRKDYRLYIVSDVVIPNHFALTLISADTFARFNTWSDLRLRYLPRNAVAELIQKATPFPKFVNNFYCYPWVDGVSIGPGHTAQVADGAYIYFHPYNSLGKAITLHDFERPFLLSRNRRVRSAVPFLTIAEPAPPISHHGHCS